MRKGKLSDTLSPLPCFKTLKQRLIDVTSFRLSKSLYYRSVLFKRINNFGSVLINLLDRLMYDMKFPTHCGFLFSIFHLSYHFSFSFYSQNLLLFVTVATSIRYQSPFNCSSRNTDGNFTL